MITLDLFHAREAWAKKAMADHLRPFEATTR
jgi:hypothetical protein